VAGVSSGGISKFNPVFASLTAYDPKFVSLSKFNPGHAKFFDLGVFPSFYEFQHFVSYFPSPTQV
jgi:hypothetical protein